MTENQWPRDGECPWSSADEKTPAYRQRSWECISDVVRWQRASESDQDPSSKPGWAGPEE
ncbi:hypothetical protein [Arthrobacter sp. NPDC058127]|uniref:hypothetical protein n=1 Tax=Arthrobacter sp. NPDC058127 TaxID=3346351 RepID=UPI0036E5F5B4